MSKQRQGSTEMLPSVQENQTLFVEDLGNTRATGMAMMTGKGPPEDKDPEVESHMSVLTFLKVITLISALYMSSSTWFYFYDAEKGEICPSTVICATNTVELALLTLSRLSAGALFASLTIVMLSKCYATRSFVHHSWLGAVLELEPTHDIHTYFGYLTMSAGLEHGLLHCMRFVYSNQTRLIYEMDVGRSGLVACAFLLPIVLPMRFEFFRTRMTFENRKRIHLLFMAMLVALCFHSVTFRYVGSILLVWYILDRLYFTTKQTFLVNHPVFEAIGRGTMVSLDLPDGYTFKAGSYVYVNSPTISPSEWHPFSIIQVPGNVPKAAFYAEAVGDWTQELFRLGLGQPRLPLWITAPQPSLMEKSIYYDNIVLVCTGAGITPAVSIVERFATRKNIHLLWMSRDSGLIALFEKQLCRVNSTVHVTGKQTTETVDALQKLLGASPDQAPSGNSNIGLLSISNMSTTSSSDVEADISAHHITVDGGENKAEGIEPVPAKTPASRTGTSGRRRSSFTLREPVDPVELRIGRPHIGKYLADTFAKKKTTSGCLDDSAAPMLGARLYSPALNRSSEGTSGRQTSMRLDTTQTTSKQMLMKADTWAVEAMSQKDAKKISKRDAVGPKSPPPDIDSGCPLPWIVLYCGANAKVEQVKIALYSLRQNKTLMNGAIAKVCNELKVNWQKEYFGAW